MGKRPKKGFGTLLQPYCPERMSVCVPLAPKSSTDILLRGSERITFKTIILKYYGVSKKWKMAKNEVWAAIPSIVSRENVCLCPPSTKCSTDILKIDNERITGIAIRLEILQGVQKMEKMVLW